MVHLKFTDKRQITLEVSFFIGIFLSIGILLTVTDIVFFDNYVLPIMSECNPQNTSEFCIKVREILDAPIDDQLEIGNHYWDLLTTHFFSLGGVMFFIRIFAPFIVNMVLIREINWKVNLTMGGIWFGCILIWFFFGLLDLGYYIFRLEIPPESLEWLNDAGLFVLVKGVFGTENVESVELYLLNAIGMIIFASLWILVFAFKEKLAREKKLV